MTTFARPLSRSNIGSSTLPPAHTDTLRIPSAVAGLPTGDSNEPADPKAAPSRASELLTDLSNRLEIVGENLSKLKETLEGLNLWELALLDHVFVVGLRKEESIRVLRNGVPESRATELIEAIERLAYNDLRSVDQTYDSDFDDLPSADPKKPQFSEAFDIRENKLINALLNHEGIEVGELRSLKVGFNDQGQALIIRKDGTVHEINSGATKKALRGYARHVEMEGLLNYWREPGAELLLSRAFIDLIEQFDDRTNELDLANETI